MEVSKSQCKQREGSSPSASETNVAKRGLTSPLRRNSAQIGCGDFFENDVVDQFNDCAVTRKGCVPQKPDKGRFPMPNPQTLVPEFDTTWFIGNLES